MDKITREQILALAADTAAVAYSPPPLRAVCGYSFTYDELEAFYRAVIQHYKDSVSKEVGGPVARIGSGWVIAFKGVDPIAPIIREHNLKMYDGLYSEAQLIAARKPLEEEIAKLHEQVDPQVSKEVLKGLQEEVEQLRWEHRHLSMERDAYQAGQDRAHKEWDELRQQPEVAQEENKEIHRQNGRLRSDQNDLETQYATQSRQLATAEQRVAEAWQPMETAPKDGRQVLLAGTDYGRGENYWITSGSWGNARWVEEGQDSEDTGLQFLTHWMPLPKAPSDTANS